MAAPEAKTGVLLVEDDRHVRTVLAAYLTKVGYETHQADSGETALEQLKSHRVAAMLSDIRMPGMSGTELIPKALAVEPDLAIIMLTGVDTPTAAVECLKAGAADYLLKPVDLAELQHSLQYALRKRELEIERRELERWLSREVALRTRELEEQSRQLARLSVNTLGALVDTLEAKDPATKGHSQRVGALAGRIAARMGLAEDDVETIRTAGRLHDIGKLAIREPGLELEGGGKDLLAPRDESDLAVRLLEPLGQLKAVAQIIRYQHERWDGKGTPEGRRGEQIPLGSRIVAAASVYDEIAAAALEKRAPAPRQALANMKALVGLMLDPTVFAALEQAV